jgi:GNAT superfamily N-acetyltransferase
MTSSITIREATVGDAEILVELRSRMLRELGPCDAVRIEDLETRSIAWLETALVEGAAAGWIAERRGRTVGGVSMTILSTQPQYRSPNGRVASVYGLFVDPEARGAGVATKLVEAAIEHAKNSGIDLVTLHAADRARPIYERLGFVASSEMRLFLGE